VAVRATACIAMCATEVATHAGLRTEVEFARRRGQETVLKPCCLSKRYRGESARWELKRQAPMRSRRGPTLHLVSHPLMPASFAVTCDTFRCPDSSTRNNGKECAGPICTREECCVCPPDKPFNEESQRCHGEVQRKSDGRRRQ